ncbi:MAG: hypothetical protein ABR550_03085 [Wenzhouxiangellaceae bacterium]
MNHYGVLDWPGLVFGWINQGLVAVLPEPMALALWALFSAWMTMWVYRRFSNQEKLAALKPQVKAVQKKLSNYDGEFSGLKPLILENFKLSGRHILLALGPALLAGIPVLFVLVWVSNAFGVKMPEFGSPVQVTAVADEQAVAAERWQWRGIQAQAFDAPENGGYQWTIAWPEAETPATLVTPGGDLVVQLPPPRPSPILHPRQWWNALIANPAGYLSEQNPASVIYLDLPKKQMLSFGPSWMRGWEFLYFVLLIIGSLSLKFVWRIH